MDSIKVLFVCMGNICRSPTAQGVFEHLVAREGFADRIVADSAGTHAYHIGEPPDRRARQTAQRRGVDLSKQRARQALREDFEQFHYVLAMDQDNHRILAELCPRELRHKLHLFMDFASELPQDEVPDPYYGGAEGFDQVFDMVEAASHGLFNAIRQRQGW